MHLKKPDEDDPAYQGDGGRQQSCQACAAPFYETVLCPPSPKGRPSEQCGDDNQHCHGKQIRHGTSPGHIEQSKAGKDQPLSSAARQTGSANGNLQLEKYGAITISGLLSYKRNLRHSRPNDRRRADVEGPPLCRLAASHLDLEHARLGRRSKGFRTVCRFHRTRQLSTTHAHDRSDFRARSERLRATPGASARWSQDPMIRKDRFRRSATG